MFKNLFFLSCFILIGGLYSQNDLDAIRYSRIGVGGSPRFVSMGGAFGALGADVSCTSYNPAGIGLFTKGEIIYSGGLRFSNNNSTYKTSKVSTPKENFAFGNFGMAFAWKAEKDPLKRNVFAFTNNQLINFNGQFQLVDNASRNSIAKDMLTEANNAKILSQMNPSYELLGYNSYVLDYDSLSGKFFSFVDLNRNIYQSRTMSYSGRMNEINISFAQSNDDKYYFGASLGIPKVNFKSSTVHYESDAKDSMKVTQTVSSFSSTYSQELPFIYPDLLGFNSLTYTEYYQTQGFGLNLKLGGIIRLNSNVRLGGYFHTPTLLNLADEYYYEMKASFDKNTTNPVISQYPEKGNGKYSYRIVTPMRLGFSAGFIINKIAAIGIDYENIGYNKSSLSSDNPDDFAGVNAVIKSKYSNASNLRIGTELNIKPVMLRAGYSYYGSPFGGFYSGSFDRHTVSLGFGIRSKQNWFFDLCWYRSISNEDYYMFVNNPVKTKLQYITSLFSVSVGLKFD